jgi:hypothetical protein
MASTTKAAVRKARHSRARAKTRKVVAKLRKSPNKTNATAKANANNNDECRHCGRHVSKMGRHNHERICSENPKNIKPHAKTKKNEKASQESLSHSRSKFIGKNNEGDLSKQYHPGAEYLSSLHAHESIRSLSGKMSSMSKKLIL